MTSSEQPTPDDSLREQYAAAARRLGHPSWEADELAAAIVDVRDRRMEQLAAGRETWKAKALEMERDRDRIAAVLGEVLLTFVNKVPGRRIPCVQSGPVDVVTLGKWRSVLASAAERPWWGQLDTMRAELEQAQAAVARVRAECDAIARDVHGKNPVALAGFREANARIRAALDGPAAEPSESRWRPGGCHTVTGPAGTPGEDPPEPEYEPSRG